MSDIFNSRRHLLLRGYLPITLGATVLIGVPLGLLVLLGAMQATMGIAGFGLLDVVLVTALVIASSHWATERFQSLPKRHQIVLGASKGEAR